MINKLMELQAGAGLAAVVSFFCLVSDVTNPTHLKLVWSCRTTNPLANNLGSMVLH